MKILKVCLVGAGAIGLVHADHYRSLDSVELTIVETDESKRARLASDKVRVLDSLDKALGYDFDLFDICTPTVYHAKAIKSVLRNTNALILCEKPLTRTAAELASLAREPGADNRLLCALVEHFNEPCTVLRTWADHHDAPYTIELKRRTKKPLDAPWFNKPELGGDILLDLGIHDIDLALWLSNSSVISVDEHTATDNNHESFRLNFANGSTAQVYLGWDLDASHQQGIENVMRISNDNGELWYDSDDESLHGDTEQSVRPRFPHAYHDEIDEALAAVRGEITTDRFPGLSTVAESMDVITLVTKDRGAIR